MALLPITNFGNKIIINMQREVLTGNVLDIGEENHGIIYSIYKQYNDDATLEYVSGKEEKNEIKKNSYDTCIMLFSLKNIWLKTNKKRFIKEVVEFLKDNGVVHIWDIDKPYNKSLSCSINVVLPENKTKVIKIKDLNIFKDTSKESVLKLLKDYFEVIDFKCSDNIYYIKAKKKGSTINETTTNRNKFKVRAQQLGNKVFKGLHR